MNSKNSSFFYRYYHSALKHADSPKAFRSMCMISFAESSFFPLPPDLLMIPMILANRSLAWKLAFWGTISSVLGGIFGYAIGYFLFSTLGEWIINSYGFQSTMDSFHQGFAKWGFWIIVLKGLTPIPYKLVTIASGVAQYHFGLFVVASVIARAFRFYLLAALLWFFGPLAKNIIEKYLTLFLLGSLIIIVGGFLIVKILAG
jgi:membrane protein YqaA with SNARE-associated domain